MPNKNEIKGTPAFIQGNEAVVEAALAAGCSFFGGYPITPSSEIAEGCAEKLPLVGGVYIQLEDEIASMASIIGASLAGAKSMTATSGPGFSLMQENLGFAYIAEVPCVIINVMRGGPSTGLPTKLSQSDVMQARFGTHGDYTPIVIAPSNVQEVYDLTIHAFNCSEMFNTPVVVLLDELLGHMREKIIIPDEQDIYIQNRRYPSVPPEFYKPHDITPDLVSEFVAYGEGYRHNITGLTHDEQGFPTSKPAEVQKMLKKLRRKIHAHRKEIIQYDEDFMDDALYAVISYGSSARAAMSAVRMARARGIRVGLLKLKTLWPFPGKRVHQIASEVKGIVVAEMNMGQMIREVDRYAMGQCKVKGALRYDGLVIEPDEIYEKIVELRTKK
ncbi:MAG TPA: 2-oxoacid:acceptor oxidoreductase subunit alpha [candidate division Zixibacteria bacterium]|nr:2-oxoacid:acceptor oxidoreductase subunit alpha [candidate division Zixibacteria bacterium]